MKKLFKTAAAAVIAAPLAFSSAAALAQDNTPTLLDSTSLTSTQMVADAAPLGYVLVAQADATAGKGPVVVSAKDDQAIDYLKPFLLWGLLSVPLLLLFSRTLPPSARDVVYSAVSMIFDPKRKEETLAKTPWWQISMRAMMLSALIVGAAHPILNPGEPIQGDGPLLLVVDNGWSSAPNWEARLQALNELISQAEREGRKIYMLPTAAPADGSQLALSGPFSPDQARRYVQQIQALPWQADRAAAAQALAAAGLAGETSVVWLSNGITDDSTIPLVTALDNLGALTVYEDTAETAPHLLLPPKEEGGDMLALTVQRLDDKAEEMVTVLAKNESGTVIDRALVRFEMGEREQQAVFNVPLEVRNQITRVEIEGENSVGAVVLLDERYHRRPVGLVDNGTGASSEALLNENYYIDSALSPYVDMNRGDIDTLLQKDLAVLVLGDSAAMDDAQRRKIEEWVNNGGTLLRFAGPNMSQSEQQDSLLPVQVQGDRGPGGALSSWGDNALKLGAFDPDSPFYGLDLPQDIVIGRQLVAQPSPTLSDKIWAQLEDGTPLITAESRGNGWVILVHTTASPNWSNLSLSGLFVDMLRKIVAHSQGVTGSPNAEGGLPAWQTLDGFGRLNPPSPVARPLTGESIRNGVFSAQNPPGFYGDDSTRYAHNLTSAVTGIEPIPALPDGVTVKTYSGAGEGDLRGLLIGGGGALLLIDLLIVMAQRGALPGLRRREERDLDAVPAPALR